jgi:hypothetical protein
MSPKGLDYIKVREPERGERNFTQKVRMRVSPSDLNLYIYLWRCDCQFVLLIAIS